MSEPKADGKAADRVDDTADVMRRGWRGSLLEGYIDIVARLVDAADRAAGVAAEYDPRFRARSPGDAMRQTPEAVWRAALTLNDGIVDAAENFVGLFDLRNMARRRMAPEAGRTNDGPRRESDRQSESEIVREVQRIINRGRHRGTTIETVIREIGPITNESNASLSAIIARHFVVDSDLVFSGRREPDAAKSDLPDSIEAHLKALGYDDVRHNVRLERLGDDQPRARMVAYTKDKPIVLVFRVASAREADAVADEDARFEARALSRSATPRYIYVTDGVVNRYLDLEADRMIPELPRSNPPP